MFDSLQPHELQHTRLPCPLLSSWSLLKLVSIESMMPSNHLILCRPLLLLLSTFPSIRVFSNEFALRIRWPKYWSFSISTSNEYSGLISFRIDWFEGASFIDQLVKNLHSMQESTCNAGDPGSISRRRKWQPTPEFLPGKSHGQRNLVGYSPWGHKSQTRLRD